MWMGVVGARLAYLQTAQHEWLGKRARAQQSDSEPLSPVRGLILDRQERELARSVDADSYFVVPGEISDIEATAARLASILMIAAPSLAE
jgi:cell division protein FtsI/penicillin-binding protein 2